MVDTNWMNDPSLQNIDNNKKSFIAKLLVQGSRLNQKEMLPFLLALTKQAKENNISFSMDEIQSIISVLSKKDNI